MLTFDKNHRLNKEFCDSPNIAERLSTEDRAKVALAVVEGFDRDKQSRSVWERRNQAALDLALQLGDEKNFPWPGCANVAFPLITIASLQFHSRAYPVLIQGPQVVKCRVPFDDPEKQAEALLIGRHMSWQRLEQDQCWEEQADRALIALPILGSVFKKTYFDGKMGINRSDLVLPTDLVMNYWAKSVETCPRKTHLITLSRNDLYEGVKSGIYCDVLESDWFQHAPTYMEDEKTKEQRRMGVQPITQPDETTPYRILEQHFLLDLDGDGYAEPYIATVERSSRCLLRLVTRFHDEDVTRNMKGQVIRIRGEEMFTKHEFIPSPDGGIYGLGFGTLLGPNNEAVNSIINQLIDSGTLANTAGGFLARGAKIRGGAYTFAPFEWKHVDSTGDDLKKSIFPMPTREPSAVLFNLLKLLIDYTNRISGTSEAMVGESTGQNTPAETSRTMVEQGMKIYTAIFKRIWRGYKEEFKKLYILNARYMPLSTKFGTPPAVVTRALYLGDPDTIIPEADPNLASDSMRMHQAEWLKMDMLRGPGGYDPQAVTRFAHRQMRIENSAELYPGYEKFPPPPNPKIAVESMRAELGKMKLQATLQSAAAKLQEQSHLNQAKFVELLAKASNEMAQADGVNTGHQIAALQLLLSHEQAGQKDANERIGQILKLAEMLHGEHGGGGNQPGGGGVPGMAPSTVHQAAQTVLGGPGVPNQG
jgi:chaperonin GroES